MTYTSARCGADGSCVLPVGHGGAHAGRGDGARQTLMLPAVLPRSLTRTYPGRQREATAAFEAEAAELARHGYTVMSQAYIPGSYGPGMFLVALALILAFGFGLLILAYMLIVKPAGTLTVTYQLR